MGEVRITVFLVLESLSWLMVSVWVVHLRVHVVMRRKIVFSVRQVICCIGGTV